MLICLEGVDGSGKSTLAMQLQLGKGVSSAPYMLHFSQPKRHPLAEYEADLDFYRPGQADVICDRFHWGEMIYSDLYRNGSELGMAGFWHVEQYLQSRGGLMVHVTAPYDVVSQRLAHRGEDYLEKRHVLHVIDEFIRWRLRSYNGSLRILSPVEDDAVDLILRIAKHRERRAKQVLGGYPGYIGPLEPKLLLVGERPNAKAKTAPHVAPFLPYNGTAAKYLIDQVILEASEPETIGLVNAFGRFDAATNLRDLRHRLGDPRVVALGVVADKQCTKLDVPHSTVPHPQYWRRFHHNEPEEYRRLILEEETHEARETA